MTYTTNPTTERALDLFKNFDTDTKLALLWYGYLDIKDSLDPTPPNSVEVAGNTLYNRVRTLSQQEQLQAQRDMIERADNEIGRLYGALDSSARMESWLLLARGMEEGTIVGFPDDYQLPEETREFTEVISGLEFEERINFTRSAVMDIA